MIISKTETSAHPDMDYMQLLHNSIRLDPFSFGEEMHQRAGISPDIGEKVSPDPDGLINRAFSEGMKLYDNWIGTVYGDRMAATPKLIEDRVALTPAQIDIVYSLLMDQAPCRDTIKNMASLFVSSLIQISYDNGYNGFTLNTGSIPLSEHAYNLHGTNKNKLRLAVNGDVGYSFGDRCRHCEFIIDGDARYGFAHRAYYSSYIFQGDVSFLTARAAIHSSFTVRGQKQFDYILNNHHAHLAKSNRLILVDDSGDILKEKPFDSNEVRVAIGCQLKADR